MKRMRYIGPNEKLKGKIALVKEVAGKPIHFDVQFDDLSLGKQWTHDWARIRKERFEEVIDTPMPTEPIFVKTTLPKVKKPKEWEPDSVNPELLTKKLREW